MQRPGRLLLVPLLFLSAGCPDEHTATSLVSPNVFPNSPARQPVTQASFAPASTDSAARVDTVGRKLIAGNPQIAMRPMFRTIGDPRPEIFHRGTTEVLITEGLARQCRTEGELAAVLCHELGKMVAQREALAGLQAQRRERTRPIDLRIGNDSGGSFGPADKVSLAEQAKLDQERRQGKPLALPPDPQVLARIYLEKSGYPPTELEAAAPLLQAAAENMAFEKQMVPPPAGPPGAH